MLVLTRELGGEFCTLVSPNWIHVGGVDEFDPLTRVTKWVPPYIVGVLPTLPACFPGGWSIVSQEVDEEAVGTLASV